MWAAVPKEEMAWLASAVFLITGWHCSAVPLQCSWTPFSGLGPSVVSATSGPFCFCICVCFLGSDGVLLKQLTCGGGVGLGGKGPAVCCARPVGAFVFVVRRCFSAGGACLWTFGVVIAWLRSGGVCGNPYRGAGGPASCSVCRVGVGWAGVGWGGGRWFFCGGCLGSLSQTFLSSLLFSSCPVGVLVSGTRLLRVSVPSGWEAVRLLPFNPVRMNLQKISDYLA